MLMVSASFPIQPIVRELLYYLQLSPFQVLPIGWRLFLASYMIWPEIDPGNQINIPEFFAIYRPLYNKVGTLAFIVRVKPQFVGINPQFVSGAWQSLAIEELFEDHMVP